MALEDSAPCPNCGNSILKKWAFCRHCGIALNSITGALWEPVAEPLAVRSRFHVDAPDLVSKVQDQEFPSEWSKRPEMHWEKSPLHFFPAEIEKQIASLEQRVAQMTEGDSTRMRVLLEQTTCLEEGLQAIRVAREIHDERRRKELQMVQGSFDTDLKKAVSERIQLESSLQEKGKAMLEDCRADLVKESAHKGSVQDEHVREIGEEVQRLHALLEKQHLSRVEQGEQILLKLESNFQQLQHDLETEQKLRFEAEGMMLRMVEDVCGRLHGEIQQERQKREAVQSKLLGLLEDTCTQIEKSFSYLTESKGF
ncbi:unnamed protein product [Durusdinium trenchii]|uniref:Zinc-ribbon domain-containing protein n=1 Tax=Durusdinium trenchii TaxID=1381693 RepID=A0ABP0J7S9_9DINO